MGLGGRKSPHCRSCGQPTRGHPRANGRLFCNGHETSQATETEVNAFSDVGSDKTMRPLQHVQPAAPDRNPRAPRPLGQKPAPLGPSEPQIRYQAGPLLPRIVSGPIPRQEREKPLSSWTPNPNRPPRYPPEVIPEPSFEIPTKGTFHRRNPNHVGGKDSSPLMGSASGSGTDQTFIVDQVTGRTFLSLTRAPTPIIIDDAHPAHHSSSGCRPSQPQYPVYAAPPADANMVSVQEVNANDEQILILTEQMRVRGFGVAIIPYAQDYIPVNPNTNAHQIISHSTGWVERMKMLLRHGVKHWVEHSRNARPFEPPPAHYYVVEDSSDSESDASDPGFNFADGVVADEGSFYYERDQSYDIIASPAHHSDKDNLEVASLLMPSRSVSPTDTSPITTLSYTFYFQLHMTAGLMGFMGLWALLASVNRFV